MNRKASTPVLILLIVLVIILLSLSGGGFYMFQKEKAQRIELEQKMEELNVKQRVTEDKLKESGKLISDLQSRLDDAKSQIDTLTGDLEKERAERLDAASKLERIKSDLEEQKGFRSDLENKLNQAQDDLRKTVARLKELDSKRADLESKIKELEEKSKQIELGKIVVSSGTEGAMPAEEGAQAQVAAPEAVVTPAAEPPAAKAVQMPKEARLSAAKAQGLEGKVLVINKDYNFVVINLGSKDGVRAGDTFSLFHENKFLGEVKVEKIHDSMAAAGFMSNDIKEKVYEGDKVVQNVR